VYDFHRTLAWGVAALCWVLMYLGGYYALERWLAGRSWWLASAVYSVSILFVGYALAQWLFG